MTLLPLMLVVASFTWGSGVQPPCGKPTVTVGAVVNLSAIGEANWITCRVALAPEALNLGRPLFCALMLHEIGHLYRKGHSLHGVMKPELDEDSIPPVCLRLFQPRGTVLILSTRELKPFQKGSLP